MNPIGMLFVGAAYGYLAGNPNARIAALKQFQKLSGAAIDGLNKQGEKYVQKPDAPIEPPEQQQD